MPKYAHAAHLLMVTITWAFGQDGKNNMYFIVLNCCILELNTMQ